MFDKLSYLYQIDWRIFMAGAEAWLNGGNPYGRLSAEFGAGAFAYPPTALPWLALFVPLGGLGFYIWTLLELLLWWLLIHKTNRAQLMLLFWAPLVLHFVEGQSSLMVVLVLWAASQARQRGLLWGLALAWALTKPQVAIVPLAWLLWRDRAAPLRWQLWAGLALGTIGLALPATLMNPQIWNDWLVSLPSYRERILQMAAWQGPSAVLFVLAAYLWHRGQRGGWQWWLTAAAFPQVSYYSMVALMPMLKPRLDYWMLAGLAVAGVLQGPMALKLADGRLLLLLPWILCGHLLAAWMLAKSADAPALAAVAPAADLPGTVQR